LNDLELAVGMVRALKQPFAVAVNRSDIGDDGVVQYCQREGIDVLLDIPSDRRIAEAYSRGVMAIDATPEYRHKFLLLHDHISERILV